LEVKLVENYLQIILELLPYPGVYPEPTSGTVKGI
jgi:hypothetical protein